MSYPSSNFSAQGHKPRISKPSGGLNIWSNAARYKGSLDDILSEDNNDENNKRWETKWTQKTSANDLLHVPTYLPNYLPTYLPS